jgi:cyanophycinase-like exopeptidase
MTTRSTLHLIGGGPGTMLSLRRHLRSALGPLGRQPLVAYVGAASGDHPAFLAMIGAVITAAGGRVRAVKLARKSAKTSTARALLEDCDAVFMSGGDVLAGMSVLGDRDLVPLFHALSEVGRPMIGISAGSIMLARAWVHFPDEETDVHAGDHAVVFPCLGIAPFHVDAHAEEDDWEELRTLLGLLARRGEEQPVGYGLTRKGALQVEQSDVGATVTALGTPAPRYGLRRHQVVASAPLALGSSDRVRLSGPDARRRAPKG